jgi:hypothetical protein
VKPDPLYNTLSRLALTACLLLALSGLPALASASPDPAVRLTVVPGRSVSSAAQPGIYDAGALDPLSSPHIEHTFVVRNDTKSPLVIDDLTSSCGCTTALMVTAGHEQPLPVRIAPGQSVGIVVNVDVEGEIVGKLEKFVWVHGRDNSDPVATLEIEASTPPLVVFSPATLDFGRLRAGEEKQLSLYATVSPTLQSRNLQLSLSGALPYLKVGSPVAAGSAAAPDGIKGTWPRLQFMVTLLKSAPICSFAADLQAQVKGPGLGEDPSGLLATDYVVATGKILGDISAMPSSLVFGTVKAGHGATRTLTIKELSPDALAGLSVTSNSPWVKVTPGVTDLGAADYQVAISPSAPDGVLSAKISFTTKSGQTLDVAVLAYVAKDAGQ